MKLRLLLPTLALLATPLVARAQIVSSDAPAAIKFPDSSKFSRGMFAQGDLGAMFFVANLGKYVEPGPAMHVRLGYDIFRWLAVQAHVGGSTHSATITPNSMSTLAIAGQALQMYVYAAEARLQLQLRRVGLYLEGGGGVVQVSSNILDAVQITRGSHFTAAVVGGVGVDLHTLNRHFSVGLAGDYLWLAQWGGAGGSHAITASTYIRYTR